MSARCSYYWKSQSGIATQYMKCDRDCSLHLGPGKKLPKVYVIIPGNPGCIQFYEKFAEELCRLTDVPVWGVSHAGHARCGSGMLHPSITECGLKAQISHKAKFLEEEVIPAAEQVYLIGHSIGCYIIVQMMDRLAEYKGLTAKGILLMPAIEKLLLTPNGQKVTSLVHNESWLSPIVYPALSVIHLIPNAVLDCLLPFFAKTKDQFMFDTIKQNIDPGVVRSALHMGLQEMIQVTKRPDALLEKHFDNLIFYYGTIDEWCPMSYYEDLVKVHGERDNIHLCEQNIPHAFVLSKSTEMARIVASYK